MAMIPLKTMLQARVISYYTLYRRTFIPEEWVGLEVLIFTRFQWKLTTTFDNLSHDERIHHLQGVLDSHLLLAYNGVTLHSHRYIFKLHAMLSILEMIVSLKNAYMKQNLNDCVIIFFT